jgi:uncharacterized RDD family membrane protein YckC
MHDPRGGLDPYAPPQVEVDGGRIHPFEAPADLASRGARLGGAIIDSVLYGIAALPGMFMFGLVAYLGSRSEPDPFKMLLAVPAMILPMLGLGIYQWYLISTRGQTLAKRWLGMRIVRMDGSTVDFASGVAMRSWLPFLVQCIPFVGSLFGLVDVLFIFGEERRCVHDLIAGTKVVVA